MGSRDPASRRRRQDLRGSAMTTMANFWMRLKPWPVTLMLRPPLGVGEGVCFSEFGSASFHSASYTPGGKWQRGSMHRRGKRVGEVALL